MGKNQAAAQMHALPALPALPKVPDPTKVLCTLGRFRVNNVLPETIQGRHVMLVAQTTVYVEGACSPPSDAPGFEAISKGAPVRKVEPAKNRLAAPPRPLQGTPHPEPTPSLSGSV